MNPSGSGWVMKMKVGVEQNFESGALVQVVQWIHQFLSVDI